jgi:Butirosin biosynthesis protein H, N-terminal/Domain of unknown function (DUF4872)
LIIEDFKGFDGRHCESTATECLLRHAGMDISEPMFFGCGQGFGFIYWKMSIMNLPFVGGRSKPFELTRSFCSNLNIQLDSRETGSRNKAWSNITEFIDQGTPVALQVDCYHLEHFKRAFHFAGHFVCVYGYTDTHAHVVDTGSTYRVALENLENARFEKGPMSAKARSWTVDIDQPQPALKDVIPPAVRATAMEFLNPPIKNFGYQGILKLGAEIVHWIDMAPEPEDDLVGSAEIMENGGTGGALFRNFYRDFLKESLGHLPGETKIRKAYEYYQIAAANWTRIAALIHTAGTSGERIHLEKASVLCMETAEVEKNAMELLASL